MKEDLIILKDIIINLTNIAYIEIDYTNYSIYIRSVKNNIFKIEFDNNIIFINNISKLNNIDYLINVDNYYINSKHIYKSYYTRNDNQLILHVGWIYSDLCNNFIIDLKNNK